MLGTRKVGHSGTLDPDATGVLLLGVGKVTRLLRYLGLPAKTYTGVIVLGTATSTLDASGEVTGTWDMSGVGVADVRAAAAALTGDILQVPPMVSAIQVDGRRLHELAREGIEIEREARPVTVHRFEVGAPDRAGMLPDRGRLLVGHLHPLAGRRRRPGAGWGSAPPRPPAHGHRILHGGPWPWRSRRWTRLGCCRRRRRCATCRRSTVPDDVAADVAHGKVLELERLGVDAGDGPWPVIGPRRRRSWPCTSAIAARTVKPSVVLVSPGQT